MRLQVITAITNGLGRFDVLGVAKRELGEMLRISAFVLSKRSHADAIAVCPGPGYQPGHSGQPRHASGMFPAGTCPVVDGDPRSWSRTSGRANATAAESARSRQFAG